MINKSRYPLILMLTSIFLALLLPNLSLAESLSFDGNDQVNLANNIAPTNITVETWFKLTALDDPSWVPFITKEDKSGRASAFAWRLGIETERPERAPIGSLMFHVSNGSTTVWVHSTTIPSYGQWYHVAGTYDGGTLRLYINGELEAEGALTYPGEPWQGGHLNQADLPTSIGGNYGIQYFQGNLDEMRIWSYERSVSEIRSAMNTTLSGLESGLLTYWDFEQGPDSAILYDRSGNSYNGLLSGATWSEENPVYALRPGDIDTSFGTAGKAFADLGTSDDPRDIALQLDGKIVAVGLYNGFKVARFNRDGTLDSTFDTDGVVTVDVSGGAGHPGGAASVAIQSDGKIVVGGSYSPGSGQQAFVLIRLNNDGSLDASFDSDGIVISSFGANDSISDVVIQSDQKILAFGVTYSSGDFALARYNTDGSLDESFGTNGKVTTDFGENVAPGAMVLQPDGKIVVAGCNDLGFGEADYVLARYMSDGTLDSSFSSDGKLSTGILVGDCVRDLALQPDGKIIAVGNSDENFSMARYHSNGNLDIDFGGSGRVVTDLGNDVGSERAKGVGIQTDGKIVVAGHSDMDFALARYDSNGSLDYTFGIGGKVISDLGGKDYGRGIALQPDGKILVVGHSDNDFAVARYIGAGCWPISTYLGSGWWYTWLGYLNDSAYPWIYHLEHGWMYIFGTSPDSVVFWDSAMNAFWWTSDTQYPYLYRFSDGEWLWYQEGTSDPRWFVKLSDGQWESW